MRLAIAVVLHDCPMGAMLKLWDSVTFPGAPPLSSLRIFLETIGLMMLSSLITPGDVRLILCPFFGFPVVSLTSSVSSCQFPVVSLRLRVAIRRSARARTGRDGQGKLSGIVERIVEIGRPSLCSNGKSPASEGGLFFFYPKFRIADWKGKAANFVGVVRLGSGAESARVTLVKRSGVDSSWGEPLE